MAESEVTEGTPSPVDPSVGTPTPTEGAPVVAPVVTPEPVVAPVAKPHWAEGRLDEVTKNWRETQRELARTKAANEVLQAALITPPGTKPTATPIPPANLPAPGTPEYARAVEQDALQIADQMAFNQMCESIAQRGKSVHEDFQSSVDTFDRLGSLTRPMIEAAAEAGNPEEIIYQLGKNPEEAQRILKLPPVKQVAAIVKFGQSLAKPTATESGGNGLTNGAALTVSRAPSPIRPAVGGKSTPEPSIEDTEHTDMATWIALRDKQVEQKRGARR